MRNVGKALALFRYSFSICCLDIKAQTDQNKENFVAANW